MKYIAGDLELPLNSQASLFLWTLSKSLNFLGPADLRAVIAEKANMKSEAATAVPVDPVTLLMSYGRTQVEKEWRVWLNRIERLGRRLSDDEANRFLLSLLREDVLERDAYQCYTCGGPLGPYDAEMHHILQDEGLHRNIPSNMVTLCAKCHREMGCSEERA